MAKTKKNYDVNTDTLKLVVLLLMLVLTALSGYVLFQKNNVQPALIEPITQEVEGNL
jgi:hypothetical protein